VGPFNVSMRAAGESREPNHILDQGFTLDLEPRLKLHADYRYSRFSMQTHVDLSSVDVAGPASGEERREWRHGLHTLDAALEFSPISRLIVRPGVRLLKRDTTVAADGAANAAASRPSKLASPILSISYTPSARLSLRGDLRSATNDGPYTRVTPRTDWGGRTMVRFAPVGSISVEYAFAFRNARYTTTEFESLWRSNSTVVTYSVSDGLRLMGGFTYDSFLASTRVEFLRGGAPLTAAFRDQEIHRVWQAAVEAAPAPVLKLRLAGNYLRTTGVGELSGEPPTAGPLRWPQVTGTADLELPGPGTLSIDLQRTYYIEELAASDNFSANILAIRWTWRF
jgi:hypothetical protein